jgi:glycosyltransferase involved in cell wall biosynthesis
VPSLTLAVPATIGNLGLGGAAEKVLLAMAAQGWDVSAIDATGAAPITARFDITSIRLQPLMWVAARSPLRYRADWLLNLANGSFDLLSSRRIGPTDVFYGFSMACLHAMGTAKKMDALRVLLAAPTYLPSVRATLETEYARLGAGRPPFNDRSVAKAVAEYREADLIRAESQLTRQSLVEGGVADEKIFILPPSVDLVAFRPAARAPTRFTVAFAGGFNIRKGLHLLLAAWELVGRDEDRLVLHGGGDGWAKRLLAPYADRANVTISVGAPHEVLRSASVCICPSLEDAFCNVALEAMASGVPVIVSDQVGAKDLVTDGREGYLVPAGDVGAIAERINHLRDHAAERETMGQAARRRAETFSLSNEGLELDRVLRSGLARRQS